MRSTIFSLCLAFLLQSTPRTTISGVVLDWENERPVPGVQVSVLAVALPGGSGLRATTDGDGKFTVNQATPGDYILSTSKEDYGPARVGGIALTGNVRIRINIKAGEPIQGLQILIAKSAVITGRILDSNGRPIPRTRVAMMRKTYDDTGAAGMIAAGNAVTDDRGEYRAFGLDMGEYFLFVDSVSLGNVVTVPTYYPGTNNPSLASAITVKARAEIHLGDMAVSTQKGASVRLHIANMTGQIPQLMNVEVRRDGVIIANRAIPAPLAIDEFSLDSLSPGKYEFSVGLQGSDGFFFSHAEMRVDDAPVDTNIVVNKGWKVSGRVDAQSADGTLRPVARIQTTLGTPGSADTSWAASKVDGTFVLTGVSEGLRRVRVAGLPLDTYLLSVREGDHDVLNGGIQIEGDKSIRVLIGTSGGSINGTMVNSENNKIAFGVVALIPDEPYRMENYRYRSATGDQNGEFVIRGIAPGTYHLFAWRELPGAAYRNTEYMQKYEGQGVALKIEQGERVTLDHVLIR